MVEVPTAALWQDFLAFAGWTSERELGKQAADWVRAQWLLFRLRAQYGDRPDRVSL